MPELPEVETVKNGLEKQILNKYIAEIFLGQKKLRVDFPVDINTIKKSKIIRLWRRSKYLIIDLSCKKSLIIHLGMSGKILYKENFSKEFQKHDHFSLVFSDNSQIIFNDPRRFGLVDLTKTAILNNHKLIKNLGPEPLSNELTSDYLKKTFYKKQKPIKLAIMDANNLVGVGNIYASEALFLAKISPKTRAGDISQKRLELLSNSIKSVLISAIESGGSTLRDYVRSDGDIGYFQHSFKVYGRENAPCFVCNSLIKRITQQGRSTYYCSNCQI
jgi:formamidopyrimidine-DNA glycosylase